MTCDQAGPFFFGQLLMTSIDLAKDHITRNKSGWNVKLDAIPGQGIHVPLQTLTGLFKRFNIQLQWF